MEGVRNGMRPTINVYITVGRGAHDNVVGMKHASLNANPDIVSFEGEMNSTRAPEASWA